MLLQDLKYFTTHISYNSLINLKQDRSRSLYCDNLFVKRRAASTLSQVSRSLAGQVLHGGWPASWAVHVALHDIVIFNLYICSESLSLICFFFSSSFHIPTENLQLHRRFLKSSTSSLHLSHLFVSTYLHIAGERIFADAHLCNEIWAVLITTCTCANLSE